MQYSHPMLNPTLTSKSGLEKEKQQDNRKPVGLLKKNRFRTYVCS